MQMEQQFGLADLLAGLGDFNKKTKESDKINLKCANCGTTYDDFRKFSRLGCSRCYDSFKEHLSTLLKKIHGSNQHLGKAPAKIAPAEKQKMENMQDLKTQLMYAIQSEDFEKAAQLRDKIRRMEKHEGEN